MVRSSRTRGKRGDGGGGVRADTLLIVLAHAVVDLAISSGAAF